MQCATNAGIGVSLLAVLPEMRNALDHKIAFVSGIAFAMVKEFFQRSFISLYPEISEEFSRLYEDSNNEINNFIYEYGMINRFEDFATVTECYMSNTIKAYEFAEYKRSNTLKAKLDFIAHNIFGHQNDEKEMTYVFDFSPYYIKRKEVFFKEDGSPLIEGEGWEFLWSGVFHPMFIHICLYIFSQLNTKVVF